MKYVGSKRSLGRRLVNSIGPFVTDSGCYVEPFCGGCNSLELFNCRRIGNDKCPYLIALMKLLTRPDFSPSWLPAYVGEDTYRRVKDDKDSYDPWMVGYVGYNSYGGKFFGGYCRDSAGRRDYWDEAKRHLVKQREKLLGVTFICGDYSNLEIPKKSVVYIDPPYKGTLGYCASVDHVSLWAWCRNLVKHGCVVFVSEYDAPFVPLWEVQKNNTLAKDTGSKKGVERLYRVTL